LELPELPYDKSSQPVSLIVGAPVIARVNEKAIDLFNNETYTITDIDHQTQTITATNETQELNIPFTNFQQMCFPAFCITIHKSQGQSYDNPYTIHEWDKLDERLKYVALSRSTDLSLINVI
jgi:ATP-dependent exoDNAse (exonuclease V) alpha subunit